MKIVDWLSQYGPNWLLTILQPLYKRLLIFRSLLEELLDTFRIIGPNQIYEEDYYAKRKSDPWRSDSYNIGNTIYEYYSPSSVIDFGCAIGAHIEPFYDNDVEIKGIDGNSNAIDHAVVPQQFLEQYDLRNPYVPDKKYDLALCFEVAEHIPKRYSDNLVDSLTKSSNIIVMTAAPPGQKGTHHVNLQPREYWYEKFEHRGFSYSPEDVSDLRERFNIKKTISRRENLMVFKK